VSASHTVDRVDRVGVHALGTTALLVVADPDGLGAAEEVLHGELAAIDAVCSRFRDDSEISRLHECAGSAVVVSPLLGEALSVAMRAAALTDGLVDPTVGRAVRDLGYDRDFAAIDPDHPEPTAPARPAPGWWRVAWNPERREVLLPRGVALDLGATAKALSADRIAVRAAEAAGCGVLVSLGGDVRAAGQAPEGGWRLGIGDDHERALAEPDLTVTIAGGGLATSSTTRRTWRRAGRTVHHLVDPHTGDVPDGPWRTVTVAAATCVDANIATTASIVMGEAAPGWLAERGLPSRLVAVDGRISTTAGWPEPAEGT
jgi:thiamine biosynthesis lipoprotein